MCNAVTRSALTLADRVPGLPQRPCDGADGEQPTQLWATAVRPQSIVGDSGGVGRACSCSVASQLGAWEKGGRGL
eukprot:3087802-Rhodomonas_salina.2